MRKISEVAEDIKSILNNIERTEEYTGETLVDINELVDEILTISCCSNTTEIRNKAIDEFAERVKEVYPFTILELEQLGEIADEMRGAE